MNRAKEGVWLPVIVLITGLLLTSCGGGEENPDTLSGAVTLSSIGITPGNANVDAGSTQTYTAIGIYSDGSSQDYTSLVSWNSSDLVIATINGAGLATALISGTTIITGTDPATSISGMTSLIVPATLVSIAVTPLDPSIPLTLTTQPFTATGTFTDSSTLDMTAVVDWSSSDTLVATITPSGGVLTTLATGTSTIMATDPVSMISGTSFLTVTPPAMSTIAITPVDPSVPLGSSLPLTATGTLTDGSTQNLTASITWNSSDPSVATVTSPGGLVSSLVLGFTTISYTDPVSLIMASVAVTVVPPALASIAVTPATPTIVAGNTQQFTATGTYTDSSVLDITLTVAWSSTDSAVATVDTMVTIGEVTTLMTGISTITATAGSVNGSTLLTVTPPALVSIAVGPIGPSIANGDTQQFTAIGTYADTSTLDLSASVTWGSSNSSVATIAAGGLATSAGIGTTAITATSGAISDAVSMTVTTSQLVSIAVTPISPSIINSGTQAFTATGTFSDGSTQNVTNSVTWSSTNATIVTVDTSGLATGDAVNTGSVTVLATSGFISGSTAMTVNANTLDSIAVTPASPSVVLGGNTLSFVATGTYSDMSTADITGAVNWSSSDTTVATIDANGIATSGISGLTTITATSGATVGTTTLNVALATLASIAVTPSGQTIPLGTTQQFTAIGTYTDSSTQDLTASVTWSSDTPGLATIAVGGLATSVAVGSLNITASSGAINSPVAAFTVDPPDLLLIDITPGSPSISGANTVQFVATGTYTDASTLDLSASVTWNSLDNGVATVSGTGLAAGVSAGDTTITVSLSPVNGSTPIIVTVPQLISIAVTPATPSIPLGNTQQFVATGTYSDTSTQDLSALATWTSTPGTGDATVDVNGLTTSVGVGTATITAESFDTVSSTTVTGSTVLTIQPAQLVLIDVTPASPSVAKGNTTQFTAIGTYTDSSTQDLTATATWNSDTPGVADFITTPGEATGLTMGAAGIDATSGIVTSAPVRTLNVTAAELVSIDLSPLSPSIVQGGNIQLFTATGNYTDGTTQTLPYLTDTVTWDSSNTAIATIDAAGLATSGTTGVTTITATSGIISSSTALNVVASALTGITVTPADPSIALGLAQQFIATGSYASDPDQDITGSVTWSSFDTNVATVNSGLAVSVTMGGPGAITAASGAIPGSTTLTVTAKELVSIAVTPVTPTIVQGGNTGQFTATGTYTDGSTTDITATVVWASSVTGVADFITTPGEVTSAATGSTTITATDGATSIVGSTALYVTTSSLVSISVTPSNPSVGLGNTQPFIATGTYADTSTADLTSSVTWSLSDPTVASISAGGLATPIQTGTTTITATSGSVGGSTLLTVAASSLVSIAVTPLTPSVPQGNTQQFIATGTFTDSSTQNLTSSVTWTSSNTAVATIGSNGLVTSLATGSTTIRATSGVFGETTLTIVASVVESILVTPVSPSIALGNTVQMAATGIYTNGSTPDLTSLAAWSSSAPGVVTISSGGLVTSVAIGTATLSATFDSVIGSTPVSVTTSLLVSIAVTPINSTVDLGNTAPFTATGTYTDSSVLDLTASATWSSSNEMVVTIDVAGLATAVSVGKVTVTATVGGVTDSTQLSVLCTVSVPCPRFAYVANRSEDTLSIYTVDPNLGQLRHRGHIGTGISPEAVAVDPSEKFVYVANSGSNNISVYTIDSTGALTAGTPVLAGTNPVSVTVDPSGQYAYVANSTTGDISAYTIDSITGALAPIGTPVLAGTSPVSVTVDPTGQYAYVANSGSDSISVYTIEVDGSLTAGTPVMGPVNSNPVSVAVDPTGQYAYVANSGSDNISVYTIEVDGSLTAGTPVSTGASSSPVSVAVDPTSRFVYTANALSNKISAYTIESGGALQAIGSPIAAGTSPYAVSVDPSGQFVHAANFGSKDVSVYTIDAATGALTSAGKIRTRTGPVSIAVSSGINAVTYTPKFAYTANFSSVPDVSVYTIDPLTGLLTAGTFATADANPFSVAVDPTGKFAYVANFGANNVSGYTIDSVTGVLTSVGAAVASGTDPRAITVDPTGRFVYVANSASNTVSVYSIDAMTGVLTPGAAVATDLGPQSVAVDPTGQFVYTANLGGDTISVYTIHPVTGALTAGTSAVTGVFPISVTVDPTGRFVYVANFGADTVSTYTINPVTGELSPVGTALATGTGPNAVTVDPSGQFAYVVNFDSNDLSVYTLNPTTGELTAGVTITTGLRPIAVAVDPSGQFAYVVNFDSDDLSIYTVNPLTGSLSSTGTIAAGLNPRSVAISALIQ